MGGGDLNMKKHFHPLTMENLERVWKAEEKKRKEEERIQQLQQELEEERRREELQQQAIESGIIKKKTDRLDWMYSGQQRDNTDDFLLGKRIESKHVGEESQTSNVPDKLVEEKVYQPKASDVLMKVKEDPLFLIKKREEQSRKELAMNPLKLQRMKELLEQELSKKKKKKKKEKKSKKHHLSEYGEVHRVRSTNGHQNNDSLGDRDRYHRQGDDEHDRRHRRRERSPVEKSRDRSRNSRGNGDRRRKRYDSNSEDERHKRTQERKQRSERKRSSSSHDERQKRKRKNSHNDDEKYQKKNERKERYRNRSSSEEEERKVEKKHRKEKKARRRSSSTSDDEEMERKRQEMIQNAKVRNNQREESVKMLKIDRLKEAAEKATRKEKADFIQDMTLDSLSSEKTSVEDRIKRGIFSKQRTKASMDKFMKR